MFLFLPHNDFKGLHKVLPIKIFSKQRICRISLFVDSADFEISQNSPRRIKISGKHDYSLINPLSVLVELQSADKS